MGHMRNRRSLAVVATTALVLGGVGGWSSATAAPGEPTVSETLFASSFEDGQPQPKWSNTVETGPDGTPKTSGVDGGLHRHPRQRHRPGHRRGRQRREHRRRRGRGATWSTATCHEVAGLRPPTGWVGFTFAEPVTVKRYALTSANDAPERDPQDWTLRAPTTARRGPTLDTRTGEASPSGSRPRRTTSPTPTAYTALPAGHHREPRATEPHPARRGASSPTAPPPRRRRHAHHRGQGPHRRLQRQGRRGLHRREGVPVPGDAQRRGPRLLVQQGLRRRHPGHADTELSYRIFPAFTDGRPELPGHVRRRSTWPSPTAPT